MTPAASGPAAVVVSRRVSPDETARFARWTKRMQKTIRRAPGYVDFTVHPPGDRHPEDWVVIYQFDSHHHLDDWLQSPARLELIAEADSYIVERPVEQRIVQPAADTVTLISAVRLRPGTEDEHSRLHHQAVAEARELGGLVRDELVPALAGAQPETVALLTFKTREDLQRWLDAPQRMRYIDAMAELTESPRTLNVVSDFAGWFSNTGSVAPKQWKQATAVIAGLVPVSLVVALARQAIAPQLPLLATVVIAAVLNVSALTWVVMPIITRVLRGWLSR